MHWYTCKSLLNKLTLGRAVVQLAGCLAKQTKEKSAVEVKVQQSCLFSR